jgi:S-DNA-T family DNA segregation ATPase FtsK/SpoIIIE
MGTVAVARVDRVQPAMPGGELVLEPPPEPERVVPPGLVARLLPIVMVLASVGFIAVLGFSPSSFLFGGIFLVSTLGMVLAGGGGRSGGARAATVDEDRRDYLRYLSSVRRTVRRIAGDQRAALELVHPEPASWPAVLAGGRLWERGAGDADFGQLRIALGTQRLATRLIAPQTGPVDGIEPVTALALRRFLLGHAGVADLPVALSLRATSTVWLEAAAEDDPAAVRLTEPRALARAIIAQYVLWHSPADALLAVVTPPALMPEWDWVKWLPHLAHPRRRDAVGPARMITSDADDLRQWWQAELAGRPPGAGTGEPHLLVVVDGAAEAPGPWAGVAGVTVLRVGAPPGRVAGPLVVRLRVGAGELRRGPADALVGAADAMSRAEALALARRMARYRPAGADSVEGGPVTGGRGLPELLGLEPGAAGIAALRGRRGRVPAEHLRVPIGTDESGAPVALDLKESALGGSGPHGLCVGATGSGKSELLRTLVLGLAAAHSSAELNLVLVDFKGGATFLGLAGLPHVSAVITNLADELTLVDRMADALAGEINRRQEVLRAAGNLSGVAELAAARRAGARVPQLPALVIVVDEFSELLSRRPEMIDLFVMIGRLGRSLGLHLLLASQRLEEGRLRGLESHLSYRIALRTFSAGESRAVLGVPDAHHLPPAPGSAFLATGTGELVRFRAAYVSLPAAMAGAPGPRPAGVRAHRFPAGAVPLPPPPRTPAAPPPPAPDAPTVIDAVLDAMAGDGPPAHRVWLPPLAEPPPLDQVLGQVVAVAGVGLRAPGGADLRLPVGLIDRPYQQRRDPLPVDLAGGSGHLAVAGGPRSGKSTALASTVLGLALTHTPVELGVHVLDFGGGALSVLAGLPHVGTVADRQQPDLVRRIAAELSAALTRRERLFRSAGVGSVEEFRARRARGEFPDEPATDLLLVVDGYLTLRGGEYDDVENRLLGLAAQGLSYGLHLAVSATRWSELRPALKDLIGSRIELRLGEPAESEVDRRSAAAVPAMAGHGLAPDGAPAVLAAPRLTAGATDAASLVAAIDQAWPGPGVPAVRLLPDLIEVHELPAAGPGIAIGVDEELAAVSVDFAADSHLICFADAESGKTGLLRLLARAVVAGNAPEQARIVLVDHRRTLLGVVPESHLIGYASTADATTEAAGELAEALRRRLPGPEVTARQLRERSWWSGPEVYLLVDDYDLVATGGGAPHPLLALSEFLPQAKDVGLHVVLARRCGGAGRALFDPVLGRLRELGAPGLVLSGSPDEGALVESVRPSPAPPGRGTLVDRRRGARRVQLAWLPEADPEG